MNYAIAFLGFISVASTVFWYISGRKYYTGPLIEAQFDEAASESDNISGDDRKGDEKV